MVVEPDGVLSWTMTPGLAAGFAGAILVGRWGWRHAREYTRWREVIRRIAPRAK